MQMFQNLISEHPQLIPIILLVTVVTIAGSMIALPWLILTLPENYFSDPTLRHNTAIGSGKRLVYLVFKNFFGLILLLLGIAMLVLPGQGLLTILGGLLLMDFPGKYQLECKLARKKKVMKALNWIRVKGNRPVFSE